MKYLFLFFLSAILSMNAAYASFPTPLNCSEIQTATGDGNQHSEIRVGTLKDFDKKNYLLIDGWIEVPSSGYHYSFYLEGIRGDILLTVLKLTSPSTETLTVIDRLNIHERIETTQLAKKVRIHIEKEFNWGPDIILCEWH